MNRYLGSKKITQVVNYIVPGYLTATLLIADRGVLTVNVRRNVSASVGCRESVPNVSKNEDDYESWSANDVYSVKKLTVLPKKENA